MKERSFQGTFAALNGTRPSVFFCVLKDIDRVRLQSELETVMNLKEDQAVLIDLGPDEDTARAAAVTLGPCLPAGKRGVVVI